MWHKYLSFATFAYNTFNSPNLANHFLYELVFGRKPKLLLDIETYLDIKLVYDLCQNSSHNFFTASFYSIYSIYSNLNVFIYF